MPDPIPDFIEQVNNLSLFKATTAFGTPYTAPSLGSISGPDYGVRVPSRFDWGYRASQRGLMKKLGVPTKPATLGPNQGIRVSGDFYPDQRVVTIRDNAHAVLMVRQAPDTSETDASAVKSRQQARNETARTPLGRIEFITDDFILETVTEQQTERMTPSYNMRGALILTSGTSGREPRIYTYAGKLIDSAVTPGVGNENRRPLAEMMQAWETKLRATSNVVSVDGNYQTRPTPFVVELKYTDQIRRGYLLSISYSVNSAAPSIIEFNFQMFITEQFSTSPAVTTEPEPSSETQETPSPIDVTSLNTPDLEDLRG